MFLYTNKYIITIYSWCLDINVYKYLFFFHQNSHNLTNGEKIQLISVVMTHHKMSTGYIYPEV